MRINTDTPKRQLSNALVAGVCAGLAAHLGTRARSVRILVLIGLLFNIPVTLASYAIAWQLMDTQ